MPRSDEERFKRALEEIERVRAVLRFKNAVADINRIADDLRKLAREDG